MKKYVIRPGDTLYQISKRTGIRLPLLLASNPQITNPNQLVPGTTIVIPELGKPVSHTPKAASTVPGKPSTTASAPKIGVKKSHIPQYFGFVFPHVVKSGETLQQIAKQYQLSMEQIQELNPTKDLTDTLKPGSVLYLPYAGGPSPQMTTPAAMPSQMGMYPQNGMQMQPGIPPQSGMMPTQTGTYPQNGMQMQPGVTQQPGMMPAQGQNGIPPTAPDAQGPHTHMPYRSRARSTDFYGKVPSTWDREVDESSSLLSSWDEWDDAVQHDMRSTTRHTEQKVSVDDKDWEGWSQTLSIRNDEDD